MEIDLPEVTMKNFDKGMKGVSLTVMMTSFTLNQGYIGSDGISRASGDYSMEVL